MATTFKWTGATSGDWATATNWSPNGTIASGDTVHIPALATNHLTTNLDRTGDSYPGALLGLNLAAFRRVANSTVKIGTSGSPLILTADVFRDNGHADLYFKSKTGTAQQPTDRLIINPTNNAAIISIDGVDLTSNAASITRAEFLSGNVTLIAVYPDVLIETAYFTPVNTFDLRVDVSNFPTIHYAHVGGGTIRLIEGTVYQFGGDFTMFGITTSTGILYQYGGHSTLDRVDATGPVYVMRGQCEAIGPAQITSVFVGPEGSFTKDSLVGAIGGTAVITLGEE